MPCFASNPEEDDRRWARSASKSAPRNDSSKAVSCSFFPLGLVSALALTWMLAGCSVCQQARRTLLDEPAQFSWKKDRSRSLSLYRDWADAAWRAEVRACSSGLDTEEYSAGFRDGFVDFVYAGGSGEPPPVPPRKFWNVGWRSPGGHGAADQWFAGFRHGASAARDGGYRQRATLYSSHRWYGDDDWTMPLVESPPLAPVEDLGPPPAPSGADPAQPMLPQPPDASDALPSPPTSEPVGPSTETVLQFQSALRRPRHGSLPDDQK